MGPLSETINRYVREGELWERIDGYRVRCLACAHRCPIPSGFAGVCKVRFHRGGKLLVPWGYVVTQASEPIEKKPFFHVLPAALTVSFGMLGCSLHCPYCQNWNMSQVLRDPNAFARAHPATADELLYPGRALGAEAVVSTYNEPLITAEWAVYVFKHARRQGMLTGVVSNGYATPQVLEYLRPWVDLFKVDLKTFSDRNYHRLGCRLEPVLDSVRLIHQLGFWLEVATLVVPGFNDSEDELRAMADFLASVSPEIPWHLIAFHKDYKMRGPRETTAEDLVRAAEIGRKTGLHYVYAGNLAGRVGDLENTRCPGCGALLIRRRGDRVIDYRLTADGRCPSCGTAIPGRWADPLQRPIARRKGLAWLARYCG
jgi:pyruvate formate lyase activating enzyme